MARYDFEVGKRRRQPNGVPAHEAVVGVGGDGEGTASTYDAHWRRSQHRQWPEEQLAY